MRGWRGFSRHRRKRDRASACRAARAESTAAGDVSSSTRTGAAWGGPFGRSRRIGMTRPLLSAGPRPSRRPRGARSTSSPGACAGGLRRRRSRPSRAPAARARAYEVERADVPAAERHRMDEVERWAPQRPWVYSGAGGDPYRASEEGRREALASPLSEAARRGHVARAHLDRHEQRHPHGAASGVSRTLIFLRRLPGHENLPDLASRTILPDLAFCCLATFSRQSPARLQAERRIPRQRIVGPWAERLRRVA